MTKVLNLKHSDEYLEDYSNEELDSLIQQIEKAKSPKFKVGDWVTDGKKVGVYKRKSNQGFINFYVYGDGFCKYATDYRLATEEEIEKAIIEQGKGYFVYNNQLCKLTKIHKNLEDKIFLYVGGKQFNGLYVNNCRLPTKEKLESLEPKLPSSWEEFTKSENSYITTYTIGGKETVPFNTYIYSNELYTLQKLLILRDVYRGDWKPDWEKQTYKYTIYSYSYNKITKNALRCSPALFSFHSIELRDLFYTNFEAELEQIKEFL